MDAVAARSSLATAARTLLAIAATALFWGLVSQRITQPAWVVAILPAALAGWLIAYRRKKIAPTTFAAIVVVVLTSTFFSQWLPLHAQLSALQHRQQQHVKRIAAQAAIDEWIEQTELEGEPPKQAPQNRAPANAPPITYAMSLRVTLDRMPHAWRDWSLTALLSLVAAIQAARMASSPRAQSNPKS